MQLEDSIPWDIIDAPVPDQFFGDDVIRANLVRHGIKNFFIIHTRVLKELEQFDDDHDLTPNSKYKGNVGAKRAWINNKLDEMREEIKWFENAWGRPIRAFKLAMVETLKSHAKSSDGLGNYNPNLMEV